MAWSRRPCTEEHRDNRAEAEMGKHDDAEKKSEGNGSGTYDPDKVKDPTIDTGKHDEDENG